MSEWDFLHDMNNEGCSSDELLEAMSTGATEQDWEGIERKEKKVEWEELKSLRDTGKISKEEFKKLKIKIFE